MGSCVSKCCASPPPNIDSGVVVQDKLVISQSPPPTNTLSCDLSKSQTPSSSSSSCSSLSASSPPVSSSNSSSSSSSSLSTSSASFLQPLPRGKSLSNELLSSGAKGSPPTVVVLDPQKHGVVKPRPVKSPVQTLQPTSTTVRGPSKQPLARTSSQSFPAKRARSPSPNAVAGRKNSRTENSSAAALLNRKLSSSSTLQRPKSASIEKQRYVVGMAGVVIPSQITPRKENFRPWSVEKETREHHIHQIHNMHLVQADESREVSSRIPLTEDLNNPFISMDCFIFL